MATNYLIETLNKKSFFDARELARFVKGMKGELNNLAKERDADIQELTTKLHIRNVELRKFKKLAPSNKGNRKKWIEDCEKKERLRDKDAEKLTIKKKRLKNIIRFNPYIIQAQVKKAYRDHTKPLSLDMRIREVPGVKRDTKQASNYVMEQLVRTGLFREHPKLECPTTGKLCKGLILVK